jgi:hypothetical protein
MKDPILEELRRCREEYEAKFGHDMDRMWEAALRGERTLEHDVVSISRSGEITVLFKACRKSAPSASDDFRRLYRQWTKEINRQRRIRNRRRAARKVLLAMH